MTGQVVWGRHPLISLLILLVFHVRLMAEQTPAGALDFNERILPILSDSCFKCHGPDAEQREAGLRLDRQNGLLGKGSDGPIIKAGQPDSSLLWQRISSNDPDVRMPPPDSGLSLDRDQKALIRAWIESGAEWSGHWSFQPIHRPAVPRVTGRRPVLTPVDAFVQSRLRAVDLQPSSEANSETLIRRVTFDLTGLPPTIAEVDAFLSDRRPGAFSRVVDRLLSSPRRGEQLATPWLDAARYADTSGYQSDGPRDMWRWRDWVIQSFNRNQPFDQFTVEQIAGDLLPAPTLDQLIATAFHRNHRGNAEGGIVPEEFAVEYVVDRVDTTGTVWMGLTVGCARCHDHKFDPVSQQDYYRLFAFFNAVPESGRALKEGNSPPFIAAPTQAQSRHLSDLAGRSLQLRQRLDAELKRQSKAFHAWQKTARVQNEKDLRLIDEDAYFNSFDPDDVSPPHAGPSPPGTASLALRNAGRELQTEHADFGYFDSFTISVWVRPEKSTGTIVSRMKLDEHGAGYSVHLADSRIQVNLVKRWLDDCIRVETQTTIPNGQWTHLTITYDGSRVARGISVYANGTRIPLQIHLDGINQSFATEQPLRVGAGISDFSGAIDDLIIHPRVLRENEILINSAAETIAEILATPSGERSRGASRKLFEYYLREHGGLDFQNLRREFESARKNRIRFEHSLPTIMLMRDSTDDLSAAILMRGQYDQPGQSVTAGTPTALPPLPNDAPSNRLGLARWLVSSDHPLTARVIVNRLWEFSFGRGLVETSEDFGVQGSRPTHPDLLDWLAAELIESGWNIRHVQRLIVTSHTYRQSSKFNQADPGNLMLARGPRFRLHAEAIRDAALSISGLLSEQVGGPSVKPYQPDGLWQEIASTTEYEQSRGNDLYRRSLYTYWKRTVAPPTLTTFDAGSRESCLIRRPRTNTPLQALALMNDTIFVESARVLAERIIRQSADDPERYRLLYRTVLSRLPSPRELDLLSEALVTARRRFEDSPDDAINLLKIGQSIPAEGVPPAEYASWTVLCNLVLNLDEAVTRP